MEQKFTADGLELLEKTATEYKTIENNVIFAHLMTEPGNNLSFPGTDSIKVEGSVFLVIAQGSVRLNVNFEDYVAEAPCAISFQHGTVLQLNIKNDEPVDAYILGYSSAFMQDVNISFSAISGEALVERKSPVFDLHERELPLLLRYLKLISLVLDDQFNIQLTRHILSSLTSAMFYQMMLLLYKRIEINNTEGMGPRRSSYVHDFLKLVHLYYTKERSVNFYASKLFISPKYLSLLVKEATGRSAARWIDHFVIMEAKNLLRYSGKNIQQVAYSLNFSNQSSFGKYFKHLTGMSPTEFQKS